MMTVIFMMPPPFLREIKQLLVTEHPEQNLIPMNF